MAAAGPRPDGRGFEEFRNAFLQVKVISQAKGSAYAEFNNTKVMVGVYGPRQSERKFGFTENGRLSCEVKLTTFASQGLSKQAQQSLERDMASCLTQALEPAVQLQQFPKAVVDVFVTVLESGGSDLAVAVTAAALALADAGIEMYDLAPACSVAKRSGISGDGATLLLDPSNEEAAASDGCVLLALMPNTLQVSQLVVTGRWSNSELQEAVELAMGGCSQLRASMREVLVEGAGQQ